MINTAPILFREEQKFRKTWVWLIVILSFMLAIGGLIVMGYTDPKEARLAIALVLPVEILVIAIFYYTRLETKVSSEGVAYRWKPFMRKFRTIHAAEIQSAELMKAPTLHYGYKWSLKHGTIHNVSGEKGIRFNLNSHKKVFISSQKHIAFQHAVDQMLEGRKRK
jgi:hypothetical protein